MLFAFLSLFLRFATTESVKSGELDSPDSRAVDRSKRNVQRDGVIIDKASCDFNDGTTGFYSIKQVQVYSE